MADWYYDYNNVDSSQVTSMLNDIGIDNLYQFIDSYRHPDEFVYTTPYEHPLASVDQTEWNDSSEYVYAANPYDYEDDYYPHEEPGDTSPLSLPLVASATRSNFSSPPSSPELSKQLTATLSFSHILITFFCRPKTG